VLIDTHCHLNQEKAFPDPATAIAEAREAGVERLVVVGVDSESSRLALELADAHDEVYAVVGWHPNYAHEYRPEHLREVEEMLAHPKAVALGEIGLDFHWDFASSEQQHRALADQLDLAASIDMPVVFHCREAYPQLLETLEGRPPRPYLFHCFTGTAEDARRGLALGALFGVDGPITYKSADTLRETIRTLPLDRLVVETDSPYMTPVPHRGKPNRPAWVVHVNQGLADTLEIDEAACAEATSRNARTFFGL
jgi:TatD DNase family protein